MKLFKRMIGAAAALAVAVSCLPLSALAYNTVTSVTTEEKIKKGSTVYVGQITLDGETAMRYVWSSDTEVCRSSSDQLRTALSALNDKGFAALVPELENRIEEGPNYTAFAFCSDGSLNAEMNSDWSSAENVAKKYYPGKGQLSSVTEPLYDRDAAFAAAVDELDVKRRSEVDTAAAYDKRLISHYDSHSDANIYYTQHDGEVTKHIDTFVTYDCDAVTVRYTAVELTSKPTVTFIGWEGEVLGSFIAEKQSDVYPAYRTLLNDIPTRKKACVYDGKSGKYYIPTDFSTVKDDTTKQYSIAKYSAAKDIPLEENLVFYGVFTECIGELHVTIDIPDCGTEVTASSDDLIMGNVVQSGRPKVTIEEDCYYIPQAYWVTDKIVDIKNGGFKPYRGTIEGGKKYAALVAVLGQPKYLSFFPKVWVNGVQLPDEQVFYTENMAFITAEIEAVHLPEKVEAKKETCTEDGCIGHYKCKGCGKLFSDEGCTLTLTEEEAVIKAHHEFALVEAKDPTCTEDGCITHLYCGICGACGKYPYTGELIDAKDVVIPAKDHDWGEWKVTTPATDDKDGLETRVCKNDPSHIETRKIPKLVLPGDVDGNGKLNMKDLATLQRYVNGWDVEINLKNADLTGDKKINMRDVAELQKLLNSLPPE